MQVSNALPHSAILDPSVEFQPGMLLSLTVIGNQVMGTVSDGTAPIGIIDDIKTKAFTTVAWNEVVTVSAVGVPGSGGVLVTPVDIKAELRHPYVSPNSFISTVDVQLIPPNGVIIFPAGTALNYDAIGNKTANSIRTIVSYSYQVPNIPGDDSTIGSGRITFWFCRMIVQTDQFETNQQYPVRANLYCSETGLFTTRRPSPIHPAIAQLTAGPSPMSPMIELLYY